MTIEYHKFITRQMLKDEPEKLFVLQDHSASYYPQRQITLQARP